MNDLNTSADTGTVVNDVLAGMEPANTKALDLAIAVAPETQSVLPGSVSETDLEKVFTSFVEWVGWDDPTCIPASHKKLEKRADLLRPRRDKIAKKLARIQGILDQIEAELRPADQKKAEAREYLAAAVAQMGQFGSMEVLTAALKKKYRKVIIHPSARKDAPAAAPAPATGTGGKEGHPAETPKASGLIHVTIGRVKDVLDREGMTTTEIQKLLSDLDRATIKVCLLHLIDSGAVEANGKRADKKYKLVSPQA